VFQDYALFPHMTVLDNVAYGLMVKGVDKKQRQAKAQNLLELVQLPDVGLRKPGQLSGGQRQRVALARALVNEPQVLLLDEPLGALDLKLREQMQIELKNLQRKLGITFIFVTHDQHEALSMSDRIGIFNQGKIEQIATPADLYAKPQTRFVAEFVGTANVLYGSHAKELGYRGAVMVRPEMIGLGSGETGDTSVTGTVHGKQYFGSFWRLQVVINRTTVALTVDIAAASTQPVPDVGHATALHWRSDAVHSIMDTATA
jgi:putative spermidine/putrescine transport system ATP-binding protein